MTTEELLFHLLKNEIKGENLPEDFKFTGDNIQELYRLSVWHDLAHLTGDALARNNLFPDENTAEAFNLQIFLAVSRYEQQKDATEKIADAFNGAKIPFVPLKGAVLINLYPKPWMRTSCDIDILIHEEDMDRARVALEGIGYTTDKVKDWHDMHFYNENIHLELHYSLSEGVTQMEGLLARVWDYTENIEGERYAETPEYFVFHHIAHMAYHFLGGGCGIRPIIDLWLLKNKGYYDEEKLAPFLEESRLTKFYKSVLKLADIWFDGGKHDDLTLQMQKYILSGGLYGNPESVNAMGAAAFRGKRKYLFRLAFPPYRSMCKPYPVLIKHKLLLPLCYVHRFFAKAFGKDRKKVKARINNTMSQGKGRVNDLKTMIHALDLKK